MDGKHSLRIVVGIALGAFIVLAAEVAQAACSVAPLGGCVPPDPGGKSVLRMRNAGVPTANRLIWRSAFIPQQAPAAVGSGTDDYEVCVYDNAALILDSLLTDVGGGTWTLIGDTLSYAAASPFPPNGILRFKWFNIPGGGKFILKGKNVNLYTVVGPPVFPVSGPIVAQITNNVTGLCLETAFTTVLNPGPPTAKAFWP